MSSHPGRFRRFDRGQRIEHGLLLFSFTVLAISGLPQKYPDSVWGSAMIQAMGGIELVRYIHHAAAILLMLETVYHAVAVAYKIFVTRRPLSMLPTFQDVRDGIQSLAYNLGFASMKPAMGRYNFGEKVEYWAVIWGTVIMIITGFMLWNPIATAQFLPGQIIPAAKAAHGGEALLAVLSIITWHVYHVHIKHFNRSIFTGYIGRHEMEEEHMLELAEIETGRAVPLPDPATVRRRQMFFVPVAAIFSLLLLVGLYVFVTFEETAIETLPRQEVQAGVGMTVPGGDTLPATQ